MVMARRWRIQRSLGLVWLAAFVVIARESHDISANNLVMPTSMGGRRRLRSRVTDLVKLWYREAKALASSDFEAALLKSTRPDFEAPKSKHVESIVR